MYCKANFKSVAKCKKRLCTAVFALFKKNTRRVAWPVLQSRCKALSALSQNTLKNTKTGRKSVGFLILTQAPKCTRSHCFPPQKHPKNGFVMRFAGKNSFFQLRARDFSFYMNAYSRTLAHSRCLFRLRRISEFLRHCFGSIQRQAQQMIFFLVKQRDLRVTLRQHCQCGCLNTAHIQGTVIENGEKARSIDPHQPVRFLAAEGRLIQGFIIGAGAQVRKALSDLSSDGST